MSTAPSDPTRGRPGSLRALIDARTLVASLIRRDIQARYRGSLLGGLWAFLQPLALLAIYTFVFGRIFRSRWPGLDQRGLGDFALTLFCGLVPFALLSECGTRGPSLVTSVPSYVKRTVFPLEILAFSLVGGAIFHALVSLGVLVAASLVMTRTLAWTLVLVPVVALPLIMLTLGLTWFLASLGVFVRDLGLVIGLLLQVLLFLSPIFYPLEAVPEAYRAWMPLNPMTWTVESFRRVVLWAQLPDWTGFGIWSGVTGAWMVLGYTWFMKTKHAFADVL
ncbi:MAG: ABC transporter permease [bacterium]